MKQSIVSISLAISFLCALPHVLFARVTPEAVSPPAGYIETDLIRAAIAEEWFGEYSAYTALLKPVEVTDQYAVSAAVSSSRNATTGTLDVTVSPLYARGAQGQWVYSRNYEDGEGTSITVYPSPSRDIYLVLKPDSGSASSARSRLELIAFGFPVVSRVPVGMPFSNLLVAPLSSIMAMTERSVPWNLFKPDPDLYRHVETAAQRVREGLPSLVYLDDGAFNEKGEPVYIETGLPQNPEDVKRALATGQTGSGIAGGVNCSGFAKWIVDGIVRPAAGSGLYIEPLKGQTSSPETHFTEPWRESRDLYFALDWTRHLASAVLSENMKKTVLPYESGADVRVSVISGATGYQDNIGYKVSELLPLMYWLAVHESGHLYLGAISRERGDPLLRQYHHIAAFFPYFTAEGDFMLAVFESAVETESSAFISRNSDAWIHLVRIRLPEASFFLP